MSSGASAPASFEAVSVAPLVPAWRVDRPFDYLVPPVLRDKVKVGSLVRIPFGARRVRGIVLGPATVADRPLQPLASVLLPVPVAPPPLDRLASWLAARYCVPYATALARLVPPRVRVKPLAAGPPPPPAAPVLVPAYARGPELLLALERGGAGTWCLRALPGHDRGALIAELVAAAAGAGGGAAIVAVPEVRYGSLVLDRLASWFPGLVRVDTAQPDARRAEGWMAMAGGHALAGGGRASVLTPAPELRLLVVDEEHHPTYKEDRSPRYDARRVAMQRARLQGAICVLVSATPTLETAWGVQRGSIQELTPSRAASRGARPIVEVAAPSRFALSPELFRALRDAFHRGEGAALLVPQRGYARAVWCSSCHRSLRCADCEAGLVFDRSAARLRCPRCRAQSAPPRVCPTCDADDFRFVGAGSERLQEQLGKAFPDVAVTRVDPATLEEGEPEQATGGPRLYVTTWIGTKAALRPPVSVVGVLDADALIRRPGFRAAESAYAALQEMAEWAGPAAAGGRLVLQTSEPGHHSIQAIVRADYDYFVERELEQRKELAYPPFSELVKLTASGAGAGPLIEEAAARVSPLATQVLGPIDVPGSGGASSLELLVKCPDGREVAERLRPLLASGTKHARLSVDVDPR